MSKNSEDKIKKLAADGKIVFADTFTIDEYDDIAREFLNKIFNLDFDSTFISDESQLSDFAGCCYPDVDGPLGKINDFSAIAEDNMIKMIKEEYNIEVSARDCLITVFEKIRQSRNITLN